MNSRELMAALDEALTDHYSGMHSRRPVPVPHSAIPEILDVAGWTGVVSIAAATGWYLLPQNATVSLAILTAVLLTVSALATAWLLREN